MSVHQLAFAYARRRGFDLDSACEFGWWYVERWPEGNCELLDAIETYLGQTPRSQAPAR